MPCLPRETLKSRMMDRGSECKRLLEYRTQLIANEIQGAQPSGHVGDRKAVAVYLCFRTLNAKKDPHSSHFMWLQASVPCA